MNIKVKGLDKLVRKFEKFQSEGRKVVIKQLDITATEIQKEAKDRAPAYLTSTGDERLNIKQRIDKFPENNGFTWKVGIQGSEDLDGYIEFGTGSSAESILSDPKYTPEIKALAMTFFKTGDGTLRGVPYLFPAFFQESPKLIDNLRKELKRLAKKP
jgi:HK97 gp10 family phage protein